MIQLRLSRQIEFAAVENLELGAILKQSQQGGLWKIKL
jgi:hypothetical protein